MRYLYRGVFSNGSSVPVKRSPWLRINVILQFACCCQETDANSERLAIRAEGKRREKEKGGWGVVYPFRPPLWHIEWSKDDGSLDAKLYQRCIESSHPVIELDIER
jgi:hypothetical protein